MVPNGLLEIVSEVAEARRILSTQKSSAPFGKFSTLLYFSTAYKLATLSRCDPIYTVLTMERLQFYCSDSKRPKTSLNSHDEEEAANECKPVNRSNRATTSA